MPRSRSMTSALVRLLAKSRFPVYVLDDQRRIIYCNEACAEWTSTDADALVGARCDYHSDTPSGEAESVASGLCPPPEVFTGRRAVGEISRRGKNGELSRRRAEFMPLGADETDLVGVVAFVDADDVPKNNAVDGQTRDASPADLHRRLLNMRNEFAGQFRLGRLVGESPVMRRVREQVRMAIRAQPRVVIIGSPGSGREHVARTIHYGNKPETAGRIVPLDCSLVDPQLVQATIANIKREPDAPEGRRPAAVLLLDVDRMPEGAQYELAGFFTLPHFQLPTLATSRRSLFALADEGTFRRELAMTLSTLVIELPALCERAEDVPLLAQSFLEEQNATGGRQLSGFSDEAIERLVGYNWPGNVDELAEVVREACARADGPLVTAAHLPKRLHFAAEAAAYPRKTDETIVLDDFLAEIEAELIQRALRRAKGNKTKAAQLLGVTRARLHRRLPQLGLDADEENDGQQVKSRNG